MGKQKNSFRPLYTIADAARIIDIKPDTLRKWAKGYENDFGGKRTHVSGEPLVTYIEPEVKGHACIPFIGLVEAFVLAEFRRELGFSLQEIRPAIKKIQKEYKIEKPLASQRLHSDGAQIFLDIANNPKFGDASALSELVQLKNDQAVFVPTIARYLKHITYGDDGYAQVIQLPRFTTSKVIIDPKRYFGDPIVKAKGIRIEDLADRFWAGDSIDEICTDFDVDQTLMEEVIRETNRPAA